MECPKCQFKNRDGARFCNNCGAELEIVCPDCARTNQPGSKFCDECGQNLSLPSHSFPKDISIEEKLNKIQRYLPEGLTEKILSQKEWIEGERREVTIMFCDMVGFTSLTESLGPEKTYEIVDKVYEILIHKVNDYEGTVNELTGDGIMALFGAPIALEDAPQRAIRSALAINREVFKFNAKLKEDEKKVAPFKMRTGINTGLVVVGTLGNDLRVQFSAVGDTVNLASRLENLAEPGTVYVSEKTYNVCQGLFRFEALGEKNVKGKAQPVKVYRVLGVSTRKTRFDVSAERGLTPLIARERELELLLDAFDSAKAGKGSAISVISEAGIGKSRLLYEFRKALSAQDVTFLQGRCLSYSRHITYHLVADILKSTFDIQAGDNDLEIKEKVKRRLALLGPDKPSSAAFLLELLSVKDSGIEKINMSPEAKKFSISNTLNHLVKKGSILRPLILIFEDLHWIDESSEDVIKSLRNEISNEKILLIFTYRPEFVSPWQNKSYHSQVNLNRLSNRESLAMAAKILATDKISSDLEKVILEKTDGVPFFIEELLRSLKDLNIIRKKSNRYQLEKNIETLEIPSSIQEVIMARVDTLPGEAREVLQMSSVINREFSYKLIKKVSGFSVNELNRYLTVLKDSGFLYEKGEHPENIYIFNHALTRDLVYDSILSKKKQTLHSVIANAIQDIYMENLGEYFGELSKHFIVGGNYKNAAKYSELAAKKAEKSGVLKDAIEHAKMRVNSLEKLPHTDELQEEIIDARVALGFYLFQMGYFIEAREAVEPISCIVEKRKSSIALAMISIFEGAYKYMVQEDYPESVQYLKKALKLSEELSDFVSFGFATYLLGLLLAFNCDFEKALHHFEKLLNMSIAIQSMWRVSAMKSNLSVYGYDYQGKVDLGYKTSDEAVRIAEDSGDIFSKAMAYTNHGTSCYYMGFFDQAENHLLKGIYLTEQIGLMSHSALAHQWLAHTYFDIGKYQESLDHYKETVRIRERSGLFPSSVHLNEIAMIRAKLLSGEDVDIKDLYRHESQNRVKLYEGCMARFISEILVNLGDVHLTTAEEWIKKGIEADTKHGMVWDLARDYALCGELFVLKGELTKARQDFETALKLFRGCGARGWAKKYEEVLSGL